MTMATARDLTVKEVAERLGTHPETVRRWLQSGRLRGYRPGGDKLGWRVRREDLEQYIAVRTNAPEGEDNSE
ncbi:MAG TPA: helix-turn-helix domain-containing protein [Dehalococcoidia bacterium]|nr:helix-turn-helix domain-containing protein [Dehalococcoidia bacterium]